MGVVLPITLFFLLGLQSLSALFTLAAAIFLTWGVADLLASILEKPRLKDRSPTAAWREDMERRRNE